MKCGLKFIGPKPESGFLLEGGVHVEMVDDHQSRVVDNNTGCVIGSCEAMPDEPVR